MTVLKCESVDAIVTEDGSLFHREQDSGTNEYRKELVLTKGWTNCRLVEYCSMLIAGLGTNMYIYSNENELGHYQS